MTRWILSPAVCVVLAGVWPSAQTAQPQAMPAGRVVRPNAVIHSVANLDRSVAFYRDAVGLTPDSPPGFPSGASPELGTLTRAHGATVRAATLTVPGGDVRLTLVQFSGVDARPVRQRLQDPGSVKLVVRVKDMDAAFARVRDRIGGVYTEDVPASSNVIGGWATFIVGDVTATLEFYRDRLGFQPASPPAALGPAVLSLQGAPTATGSMSAGVRPPGAAATWRMYDFRNVERARLGGRLQDPGTPAISFLVDNVQELLAKLKVAGVAVETLEARPVNVDGGLRVFVRDPNGLLIELVEDVRRTQRQ